MKKIILAIFILFSINLSAGLVDDGQVQYKKGNYAKAYELYKKACDNRDALACYNLADLYAKGKGVKKILEKLENFIQKHVEIKILKLV